MNYLSHAVRFLDRPWFMAGTAVPDWLSVADRPVRVRSRDLLPFLGGSGTSLAEIAAGIQQHLDDDGWFHGTRAFSEVSHQLTRRFRELLIDDDSPRAPFLGHIVTEILLDALIVERRPDVVARFYDVVRGLDSLVVQQAVNRMARRTTGRLAAFIELFKVEQFLWDYRDPERLWGRLNQVLRRVKLDPLPPETPAVLASCRAIVDARRAELLPGYEAFLSTDFV